MNNQKRNEGKKLSFYQLVVEEKLNIEIPIIQRDYVQGRKAATSIRNQFVYALFHSLENKEALHLDFVYGNVIDNKLTPLDGQQRLTTLFLLHWFLSIKEEKFELFENFFKEGKKSRFSYETRLSSRDFCQELVNHKIDLTEDFPTYKQYIKNCNWYFSSWDRDPTIQSMLVMLDTFGEIYKNLNKEESFFEQLIDNNEPTITFQFIELRDFGLTDSLYIKMNARGKPLTDFENFKAKFEQLLKNSDKENGTDLAPYFENKIDTSWTDVFWAFRNKKDHLFDNEFMNFIRVVATNSLAAQEEPDFQALKSMTKDKTDNGFYELESYGAFSEIGINDIISFLDLIDDNGKFKKYLSDSTLLDEENLFLDIANYELTYIKRLQFYALYKYVEYNDSEEGIEEWVRIIRNLTSNSVYRQAESFETALKSIIQMLPDSTNILEYFRNGNKPNGFLRFQLDEEEIKAFLIEKSPVWEEKIKDIENHPYFKGQIEFLLNFSGITDFFKEHKNCDWDSTTDKIFLNQFDYYTVRAATVFTDSGLRNFPNFLFERALLTFGNYTLPKGRNRSFLIDVDREIGWKRLLRDAENNKRIFVQKLFDSIEDPSNIENELNEIIAASDISDWRKYFVEYPEVLAKCGKEKLFRVDPYLKYRDILILEKRQTNGMHREYYTYGLCCKLRRSGHHVRYFPQNSVDLKKHISYINNHKVEVSYNAISPNDGEYIVETEHSYETFEDEIDVIEHLETLEILN